MSGLGVIAITIMINPTGVGVGNVRLIKANRSKCP